MPDHWATEGDGYLRLCVAKGTLVPAKTLRCGHPQATAALLDLLVSLLWLNPTTPSPTHPASTLTPPSPQASAKRRRLEQNGGLPDMSNPAALGMHMHRPMGNLGMHMPMGALGMPMGAMGMPAMSPSGRRPGAPVKIVWSVEEDQQLLQVLCVLRLASRFTPQHHSVILVVHSELPVCAHPARPSWQLVHTIGPRWSAVAAQLPGRVGKQCRERCIACIGRHRARVARGAVYGVLVCSAVYHVKCHTVHHACAGGTITCARR